MENKLPPFLPIFENWEHLGGGFFIYSPESDSTRPSSNILPAFESQGMLVWLNTIISDGLTSDLGKNMVKLVYFTVFFTILR